MAAGEPFLDQLVAGIDQQAQFVQVGAGDVLSRFAAAYQETSDVVSCRQIRDVVGQLQHHITSERVDRFSGQVDRQQGDRIIEDFELPGRVHVGPLHRCRRRLSRHCL